jgi:hypothetical protein
MPEKEKLVRCIAAGEWLSWMEEAWRTALGARVRSSYPRTEWKIPHSELAMHTRAAGKRILAVSCQMGESEPSQCAVVFEDDGTCGQVDGLASEVLPVEMRKKDALYW